MTQAIKAKHQRLVLVLVALAALVASSVLKTTPDKIRVNQHLLGGGYAHDLADVVAIHAETFRLLRAAYFGGPRAGPAGGGRGRAGPPEFAGGPPPG